MDNKIPSIFAMLAAILCVCALSACGRQTVNSEPSSAKNESTPALQEGIQATATPVLSDAPPVPEDEQDADAVEGAVNTGDMSDEELVFYLLSEVPEAYDRVMVMPAPLTPLVTGETTELDGVCRDIWLGTDLDGKFTREILYTISASGEIYEYDPLEDAWEIRNMLRPAKLAYVKLDKVISDGFVQFLVDEVLWIDDISMPNGYAIDNEIEDWAPYTADIWTECHVWLESSDGMERYQISLDNFVEELRDSGEKGALLADVIIDGDHILSISERYTP